MKRTEVDSEWDGEEKEEGSWFAAVLGTQHLETFNCICEHRGIVLSLSRMIHGHSSDEQCVQNSRVFHLTT